MTTVAMIDWVRLEDGLPEDRGRLVLFTNGKLVMSGWRLDDYRGRTNWQISGMETFSDPTHWAYVEFPETRPRINPDDPLKAETEVAARKMPKRNEFVSLSTFQRLVWLFNNDKIKLSILVVSIILSLYFIIYGSMVVLLPLIGAITFCLDSHACLIHKWWWPRWS